MFKYSDFVSVVKNDGLARQNRFFVMMPPPALKGEAASLFANNQLFKMLLLCKTVNVPGVNIATNEARTTGEVTNVAYDRNFGEATFTFYVDRGLVVRRVFDEWFNIIQDPDTKTVGWYKNFTVDEIIVSVIPRSESGVVYTINLYECFPKSISALSLDQANNDIMTLDVTMSFKYYKTDNFPYVQAVTLPGTAPDTYTYVTPANQLPGLPSAIAPAKITDVRQSAISAFSSSYSALQSAYTNDFVAAQKSLVSGEVIINGVGVPLDLEGAFGVLKTQSMQTVKSAVVGSIANKTGIRLY